MSGPRSGETASQYTDRIEADLSDLRDRIETINNRSESEGARHAMEIRSLRREHAGIVEDRDFLREQLTELQQQIRSDSAPRTRQQMARLIAGVLRGEDWRHGAWR